MSSMEMQQKLVIQPVGESSKENYNKVVLQKQMIVSYNIESSTNNSIKKMEEPKARESPGIVKRRIMEMSSRLNANQGSPTTQLSSEPTGSMSTTRTASAAATPGRTTFDRHSEMIHSGGATTTRPAPIISGSVSPRLDATSKFPKTLVSVELAPFEGPQSRSSGPHHAFKSLEVNYPEDASLLFSAPSVKQRSVSFKSTTALTELTEESASSGSRDCHSPPAPPLPHRSASLPRQSQKPAIPPKPRPAAGVASPTSNISLSPVKAEEQPSFQCVQQSRSQGGHLSRSPMQQRKQQQHQQQQQQRVTDGFNGINSFAERGEPFVVPDRHNTSLPMEEQQRLDLLLRRRQSYSEFEDLIEKKREIRERMLTKITLLRQEREILAKEKLDNDLFGQSIRCHLEEYASVPEISKYLQFLDEIEQITKLSVGLTIRLGRLSRKIETATTSREERNALETKKLRLEEQAREAEFLHQNTDRRQLSIRKILAKYLNEEALSQYDSFLVNLIKLITELKETDQRIQLGEEQLVALNDNLNTSS